MNKKFTYCYQKNTPCNQNAQLWYYVNAVNKFNSTKDINEKIRQLKNGFEGAKNKTPY